MSAVLTIIAVVEAASIAVGLLVLSLWIADRLEQRRRIEAERRKAARQARLTLEQRAMLRVMQRVLDEQPK